MANTLAQLLALAGLPLAVLHLQPRKGATHLTPYWFNQLAKPIAFVGAILGGTFTWYLALRLAWPVVEATHRQEEVREVSRAITGDGAPLPWMLVASAMVPGTCEELLHRGILLPSLAARAGRPLAVVAVTVLFAVMHIEPARMVSAAVVGLAAGIIAIRTASVWPAVTLHVVNNVWALLLGTDRVAPLGRLINDHPDAMLAVAVGGTFVGVALASAGRLARSDLSNVRNATG